MTIAREFYDQETFRVWPDGTVQWVEYPDSEPRRDMSDDYVIVWAYGIEEALAKAKAEGYV